MQGGDLPCRRTGYQRALDEAIAVELDAIIRRRPDAM